MLWLAIAAAALWLLATWHDLAAVRSLPDLPPLPDDAGEPAVTVVMAVRDDGALVADAVHHWLAQTHVDLQLVVVDDRSRDQTATVLAALADAEPRLTVHTVRELPPEWLGKSHALHVGTAGVTTRWLLLTDGDARLTPQALARAIAAAERSDAQHVCLLPDHRDTTFLGRVCLLAFQLTIQRRVYATNRDRPRAFVGTGAFNLARTDAYRQVGGHERLRLEVVDDVWLGYLLHRAGYRSRVWLAARDFVIDWGATPKQLLRVVDKNMFAVLRYRTLLATALIAISTALMLGSLAAPWWLGPAGWLPFSAYLLTGLPAVVLARREGWHWAAGLLVPFGRLLLPIAMANSMLSILRSSGVRWRDTFYPLAMLRRGQLPLW